MKHLLSALSTRKVPLDTQEADLRALLSQAHRLRGDSKGGETWEETLEKVLVELRSMEYAAAFLKPVKKSEAWDYDKVITHPMDLHTMGKKIRSHSYMNKRAFHDDLNLIWDNCLTYNTDPNHPLRRHAVHMRKKADQIMRRIPDRHERFAPSMIEKFKFAPTPSPTTQAALPNGVSSEKTKENGMVNGVSTLTRADSSQSDVVPPKDDTSLVATSSIRVGGMDTPFEDRPALERTGEGMAEFVSLNEAMDDFLASWDLGSQQPSASGSNMWLINGNTRLPMDVNQRLDQLVEEDEELDVWKVVNDDLPDGNFSDSMSTDEMILNRSPSPGVLPGDSKKRKRRDDSKEPRKRSRLEKVAQPERNPLENWWHAMESTTMLANAIPESFSSNLVPNPLFIRHQNRLAQTQSPDALITDGAVTPSPSKSRRRKSGGETQEKPTLFRLMSENIRVRKRARDIAIRISDQIEDEKQGVDPEDMAPLVPIEEPLPAVRKTWANRATLYRRRLQEFHENEIGAADAQDCMETSCMLILEHANFDSASVSTLRVLGDVLGKCIQNLGKTLKDLHETHEGKMTAEEMVLHTLFSNSIGSIHELEAYIKGDIIKHGATLQNMLTTLEDVATKKDEPVDEEAMLKDDNEVMTGLGDLGEDIYGFREMGLDTEFGLKSLVVPKRLLRPRAKEDTSVSGLAEETDKYPAPPPFSPLETKRIDSQIGLLRKYYHERVLANAPPPRYPTPPPLPPPPPPPVIQKSPTPEPMAVVSPPSEPEPPVPAPTFDPYNPSALSISVPKSTTVSLNKEAAPSVPPPSLTPVEVAAVDGMLTTPRLVTDGLPPVDQRLPTPIIELPAILEDDDPDPARVKVGPLGQIHVPSAATVAKQKRQSKAAAQAKAAAASAGAVVPISATSLNAAKPKKTTPKKPKKLEGAPPPIPA